MQIDLRTYLAEGRHLLMLNPGKEKLPEHLCNVGAIFVDREGTGLSVSDAQDAIQAARAMNLAAVIRTDGLSRDELTVCARLAPDGLVLPQITTAAQLEDAIKVLRRFGLCIIAQIETVEAVEALRVLTSIDGVDAFLIGPNDLSAAMGLPGQPDHEDVLTTVEAVVAHLTAAGRVFGLPIMTGSALRHWSAKGAQLYYVPLNAFRQMETFA